MAPSILLSGYLGILIGVLFLVVRFVVRSEYPNATAVCQRQLALFETQKQRAALTKELANNILCRLHKTSVCCLELSPFF